MSGLRGQLPQKRLLRHVLSLAGHIGGRSRGARKDIPSTTGRPPPVAASRNPELMPALRRGASQGAKGWSLVPFGLEPMAPRGQNSLLFFLIKEIDEDW